MATEDQQKNQQKNQQDDQRHKRDAGKTRWDLMPFTELDELAQLFTFGASKYEAHSYRKVSPYKSRYVAAALRHFIVDWLVRGEERDKESGAPHLIAAVWNLLALRWGEKNLEDFGEDE